jgi:hypothetical protein
MASEAFCFFKLKTPLARVEIRKAAKGRLVPGLASIAISSVCFTTKHYKPLPCVYTYEAHNVSALHDNRYYTFGFFCGVEQLKVNDTEGFTLAPRKVTLFFQRVSRHRG